MSSSSLISDFRVCRKDGDSRVGRCALCGEANQHRCLVCNCHENSKPRNDRETRARSANCNRIRVRSYSRLERRAGQWAAGRTQLNLSRRRCHLRSNIFLLENALNESSLRSNPQIVGQFLFVNGILVDVYGTGRETVTDETSRDSTCRGERG